MTAYGYVRISTIDQDRTGQERKLRAALCALCILDE
jgi:DNA invertase Pin-like site-specific DNA recombinase